MKTCDDFLFNPETELDNLLFYPEKELVCIAEENPGEIRCECIAELFRRWFITRSRETAALIDSLLPNGERESLKKVLQDFCNALPSREKLTGDLWETKDPFSLKCQAAVRSTLIRLCYETAGFIPVYMGEKAFFIPFSFEEGPRQVADLTRKRLEIWSESYAEAVDADFGYTCVIHCAQEGLPPLTGNSLMLPLLLASWRKKKSLSYNHLRLLATGAIEKDSLKAVETFAKAQALKAAFPDAGFLFPESTKYCAASPQEIPLSVGMTKEDLRTKIPEIIELYGLQTPNLRDAIKRLPRLLEERDGITDKWEELLKRTRHHQNSISKYDTDHAREYMLVLMLESSILCHMGKTQEALKINKKAQKFAAGKPELEKLLRRMEVEELVELQDNEMFDELFSLAEALGTNIEKLEDPDLLMRYYGTMGQAWAYGTLAGRKNCSKELAKECFDKAVEYAATLNSPGDLAQDLNYQMLWYALFDPVSEEADEHYGEVEKFIAGIEGDFNENVRSKNRNYLLRLRALSFYRALLMGKCSDFHDMEQFTLPGDWWLPATVNKYCGAVCAAIGETDKSRQFFETACQLQSDGDPAIDMIRLTIYAEIWRSLGDESCKAQALTLAEELSGKLPSALIWQEYLKDKRPFPGLEYWY